KLTFKVNEPLLNSSRLFTSSIPHGSRCYASMAGAVLAARANSSAQLPMKRAHLNCGIRRSEGERDAQFLHNIIFIGIEWNCRPQPATLAPSLSAGAREQADGRRCVLRCL
ncbi:hypothetical protein, partial [Novosphingobium sp.]|uniref:hypothetical protein n=1 Tax=Novosphingobium sp. TaxID=1874826 RepID=UPI0031CF1C7C